MARSFCILLVLIFIGGISSPAQEKLEQEVKVKSKLVPEMASNWLGSTFKKVRKVKWYEEYSQEGKSFEAKFWSESHFFSVEFDSTGQLIDVEVEIQEDEIPETSWAKIQEEILGNFQSFNIQKIQRQFGGEMPQLAAFFQKKEGADPRLRYEIVFEGKNEGWSIWEGLFDESGTLISLIPVQLRLADNLIF